MGVEFDDLHPLRHRWRAVEHITGGTSKKLTRKQIRETPCDVCGVPKLVHRVHEYRGYGHGNCMKCYEPEDNIIHEKVQARLI